MNADGTADEAATETERERQRAERGDALFFDFGPPLEEVLASCKAETGLEPPIPATPLKWSPLEDGAEAQKRVREKDDLPGDIVTAP
jgi:N-methylhydantoinase B